MQIISVNLQMNSKDSSTSETNSYPTNIQMQIYKIKLKMDSKSGTPSEYPSKVSMHILTLRDD